MSAIRVILITVAGPGGHVDVGVRSDATPAELAVSLAAVLGISPPWPVAEHRAPPRPGEPRGRRTLLEPGTVLADAGVTDGDLVLFRQQREAIHDPGPASTFPPGTRTAHTPAAIGRYVSPPPAGAPGAPIQAEAVPPEPAPPEPAPPEPAHIDLAPAGPRPAEPRVAAPAAGPGSPGSTAPGATAPGATAPGSTGPPAAPPRLPATGHPYGPAPYLGVVGGSGLNGHGVPGDEGSHGPAASHGGLTDYGAAGDRIRPDGWPGYRAADYGSPYQDPAPGYRGSSYLDTLHDSKGGYPGGAANGGTPNGHTPHHHTPSSHAPDSEPRYGYGEPNGYGAPGGYTAPGHDRSQPPGGAADSYPPQGYRGNRPGYAEPGYGANPGQPGPPGAPGGYAAKPAGFTAETGDSPGERPDHPNPRFPHTPLARPVPEAGPATGAGPGRGAAATDRTAPEQPSPEQGAEQE